ncbi:serine hydrolase [Cohnella sp. WQ 127256]|uniref:serine hydrolase domain-containing protein n=1 Tax=Cohnella sp. WQ 127256 TaxID=2938790 RepID=UPI0021187533|nr:serine hydrolase domain-containing protein [Cohnella sp. WQ 127256]
MNDLTLSLDKYLTKYENNWPLSGAILVARNGEVILRKAFGYASIEHQITNSIDTKFRIWSLTKSFTALAIMMLYEQNLLRFEDRIGTYLPELKHFEHISITHLLNHTSGLINYTSTPDYNKTLNKLKLTHQKVLNLFMDKPLSSKPGTSFAYNNSGYYLLGMIIENITGLPFANYITNNILKPLGMVNTGIDDNKRVVPKMAASYHSSWEEFVQCEYMDMSSIFAAGAMYSTIDDLYKWDQALYSDTLVSTSTMEMAFTSNDFNYGFGWFLDQRYNRRRIYHGGAYRGFRSEMHRYPDEHTTIIMLTNYDFVPVTKLTEALSGLLFGENIIVPTRPPSCALQESTYASYMGTYEGYGCKAIVSRNEDQLYFIWNDEAVIPFYPISETKFHHIWQDWECDFTLEHNGELSFLGMQKTKEPSM